MGDTPLHIADREGRMNYVARLFELGSDKSITNYGGNTAEQVARAEGHEAVADYIAYFSM